MAREQFDLSQGSSELLTKLMEQCELPTKKAVLENALAVFGWAVAEIQKGNSVAAINEAKKVYRELTMPAFENAKHGKPARQAAP
jgi:hypothetical protein